jgi:hypothetical protein
MNELPLLDINLRLGKISNSNFHDLLNFVIAGSGIHGMDNHMKQWSDNLTDYLYGQAKHWRANRTWTQFFEFIFDENGYRCEEVGEFFGGFE